MSRVRPCMINVLAIVLMLASAGSALGATSHTRHSRHRPAKHHHQKILKQGGWAGAGVAAGRVAGPAGSAAVGAAKFRRDLKAGGHRRKRAAVKIGGPIAAGAIAGPAGIAGYAAVEHRHWIKRHILRMKPHRSRQRHTR